MRLALYASTAGSAAPNLVALQDERLTALPTVLVCPLRAGMALTGLRVELPWGDHLLTACPELARPIRRSALHPKGWLDELRSQQIMDCFQRLLAR
ncbi:MAG: hypothetical protein DME76_05475 [Verrucomicrobia bacterium]|nr:MAG: hypothetical protein DME76_05475 [Verrucomicrobiota bacterium]